MPPGPEPSLTDLKRSSAAWILKIKEKHKLPQVAVQGIITQVTSLFQVYLSSIHRETQHPPSNARIRSGNLCYLEPDLRS